MPRYVSNSTARWLHSSYKKAYCYRSQGGMVYTCIDSYRQATGYEWKESNKRICLQLLNDRLIISQQKLTDQIKYDKTIFDLIKQFTKDYTSLLDKSTQQSYKFLFETLFQTNYPLNDTNTIREIIIDFKNNYQGATNTIWKKIQRLRKFFQFGVDLEWMDKNPVPKSLIPKYEKKEPKTVEIQQIYDIIKYFNESNHQLSNLIEFSFLTAMRIGEIIGLTWDNVKENRIDFIGKGKAKRTIPVEPFPRLREILAEQRLLSEKKVFTWLNQQNPQRELRAAFTDLDYEFSFHTIRKTTINYWRNKNINQEVRNLIAGHSKDVEAGFYLTDAELEFLVKGMENIK